MDICFVCKYWKKDNFLSIQMDDEMGQCRRNPPSICWDAVNYQDNEAQYIPAYIFEQTFFPVTGGEDWCGEFAAKT